MESNTKNFVKKINTLENTHKYIWDESSNTFLPDLKLKFQYDKPFNGTSLVLSVFLQS